MRGRIEFVCGCELVVWVFPGEEVEVVSLGAGGEVCEVSTVT
jgi:hypothetical protein